MSNRTFKNIMVGISWMYMLGGFTLMLMAGVVFNRHDNQLATLYMDVSMTMELIGIIINIISNKFIVVKEKK